jgi:hypothetical protein
MEFFKRHFHDVNFDENRGEVKVLCPFHNDSKPSATVNTDKNLFHCWVCGVGYNEEQFMAQVKGISIGSAYKLMAEMSTHSFDDWDVTYKAELWADEEFLAEVHKIGLDNNFIDEMGLGLAFMNQVKTLAIPVFFDGTLMDIRRYNLTKAQGAPKMSSDKGARSGWVIPYDIWKHTTETTYVFEGEKDMMTARRLGLNAVCLTGGAGAYPNEYTLPAFSNRDVVICYDNDKAGRDGTESLGNILLPIAKSVNRVDISEVVSEEKEDFYDYITKYDGDLFGFLSLPQIPIVKQEVKETITTIREAFAGNLIKKKLTSLVTVTSEFDKNYNVYEIISGEKTVYDDNSTMERGEKRYWTLEDNNVEEVLSLVEVDAKQRNLEQRAYELLRIPKNEKGVTLEFKNTKTVYRSVVADKDMDGDSIVVDLYSFEKLKVGRQYKINYRLYPHPTKNQIIVAVATNVVNLEDSGDFVINENLLSHFKLRDSIPEHIDRLYQSAKHHVAKHMDYNIWLMSDLVFNSILHIPYGEVMRGALDVFMLGDTEVGKSETTSKLVDLYNFGHFLSLKTSTTVGLIGGSNKVDGAWCNTIGAIPRQHKRLVVLEEFSGADSTFIKTMTDIRSSGELRLTRGAGELRAPAVLRMITISNPINDETGTPRFLSSFPNGVIPIMELVKSAEDVRRYDAFITCPKRDERSNPFAKAFRGEPIPKEAYEHKIQWVVTRKPSDVKYDEGVESYIWEQSEYLNEQFECSVPIFGNTTAKKLARFCVAMASLLLNTDDSYESVIVTKEIVDTVVVFLERIYKDESFKLDAVKQEWESYSKFTEKDRKVAEELYPANTVLFEFLSKHSRTSRANLQAVSGKDRDAFNVVFNLLVRLKLVRLNMESIYPTEKFRKLYAIMSKTTGEMVSRHSDTSYEIDL